MHFNFPNLPNKYLDPSCLIFLNCKYRYITAKHLVTVKIIKSDPSSSWNTELKQLTFKMMKNETFTIRCQVHFCTHVVLVFNQECHANISKVLMACTMFCITIY